MHLQALRIFCNLVVTPNSCCNPMPVTGSWLHCGEVCEIAMKYMDKLEHDCPPAWSDSTGRISPIDRLEREESSSQGYHPPRTAHERSAAPCWLCFKKRGSQTRCTPRRAHAWAAGSADVADVRPNSGMMACSREQIRCSLRRTAAVWHPNAPRYLQAPSILYNKIQTMLYAGKARITPGTRGLGLS